MGRNIARLFRFSRTLICTKTNTTTHDRFSGFPRRSPLALCIANWLAPNNDIYVKLFVRIRSDPFIKPAKEVEVVNDQFVRVKRLGGSNDTALLSKASRGSIAPNWMRSQSTERKTVESDFWPSEMKHGNGIAPMDGEYDEEVIT